MRNRLALLVVVAAFTGACKDKPARPDSKAGAASAPRAAASPAVPSLERASAVIENLSDAPPEARERLENTVKALAQNQTEEFLAMVSTGGFAVGTFSLAVDQVGPELQGRSISELTTLPCEGEAAAGCQWSVTMPDAKRIQLAARSNNREVGSIELVREDDGSWGVFRAYPAPR